MRFTSYLTAGALAALARAQTFTDCNPMEKDDCKNDPAMPATFETDFKQGAANVKGWKQTAGALTYSNEGAQFTINKRGEAPTIQSEGYLHFGYVEVKCKASPGQGIISSIVVQSEDLDEVDWEFLGGVQDKVQMNYFGKGNTTSYDRMIEAPVPNVQEMHTYALNWTSAVMTWIIDGQPVRTLKYEEANGGKNYPQTPSTVRIGIWAGGDADNNPGTIEWAGGQTDYTKVPFTMTVESVKVTNYSPGKEYEWTDRTGSFQSIKVIEAGNKEGAPVNSAVLEPSASASGSGGLQSQINVPSGTGKPAASTPCSTGAPYPSSNGTVPAPPANGSETSCSCDGVATVTMTGNPPPAASTVVDVPPSSAGEPLSSPPATQTPLPSAVSPSSGLIIETSPAPSMPVPVPVTSIASAPSGVLPTGNATVSSPPAQFTGAATLNKAGTLMGVVAGVVLLAF